jgi:hypothetical protein
LGENILIPNTNTSTERLGGGDLFHSREHRSLYIKEYTTAPFWRGAGICTDFVREKTLEIGKM